MDKIAHNKEVLEEIMNELFDEISLGLCFELHRSCKIGTFFLDEMDDESQKMYAALDKFVYDTKRTDIKSTSRWLTDLSATFDKVNHFKLNDRLKSDFEIVNIKGRDVFGQAPNTKKQYDCMCPNCHHSLAASRFAPHLEKCMGMGTSGPRIASRRVSRSTNKKGTDVDSDEDNSNDGDWTYSSGGGGGGGSRKGSKKMKKEKRHANSKGGPKIKIKIGEGSEETGNMEDLQEDEGGERAGRGGRRGGGGLNAWDTSSPGGSSPTTDSSSVVASVKAAKKHKLSPSSKKKKRSRTSSSVSPYAL